ncbi:hypothetical protein V499_05225 [Pseudogymnoascus sp. VKM F-103]|nr:hypothetical protein V499_05225 [Pseudogymnoascus sp. VKM F-103]
MLAPARGVHYPGRSRAAAYTDGDDPPHRTRGAGARLYTAQAAMAAGNMTPSGKARVLPESRASRRP